MALVAFVWEVIFFVVDDNQITFRVFPILNKLIILFLGLLPIALEIVTFCLPLFVDLFQDSLARLRLVEKRDEEFVHLGEDVG